jgi:hypothetical protein
MLLELTLIFNLFKEIIMKKGVIKKGITFSLPALIFFLLVSCTKQLDQSPTNGITNTALYNSLGGYKQSLITLYSTLAFTSSNASYSFIRTYWSLQEFTTDEAISTWDDPAGIQAYHSFSWTAANSAVSALYNVVMYNITLCNNFIIESGEAKIAGRGYTGASADSIRHFAAEARFIRSYYYWIMMDIYGNPPFATDSTLSIAATPKQILRKDLFNYIESELKAVESVLANPKTNEYGRADRAAAWALLARMYLNANIYTGTSRYSDAVAYCNKIIGSNAYSLVSNYNWLMLADNYLNTNEFILTINYDNAKIQTWGGTNYLSMGAAGVPASVNGLGQSWGAFRFTQSIPALFPTTDTTVDKRGEFWTQGQQLNADVVTDPTYGYSSYKYRNVIRTGAINPQRSGVYTDQSDIDFPVFRLAEIYLVYVEAVVRGGSGGSMSMALSYINQLRGRAYANNPNSSKGNITAAQLTPDFILDERARELYWEGHRRTDLIRYNKLTTGTYLWAWKGGVKTGAAVSDYYNLFPIPSSDILANSALKQNPGY